MPLSLVTAPTEEPLTWSQVQKQLRLDGIEDDRFFVETVVIPAARDRMELATNRVAMVQTWDYVIDEFPREGYIELPKPPLVSVSFVKYVATNGTLTTWAASNYLVQAPAGPRCARGRVALAFASVWPVTLRQMGAVTVRFVCGASDAANVPPLLLAGMLMDCGRLYEYRESLVMEQGLSVAIKVPDSTADIYWSFRSHATQRLRGGLEGSF